MDGHQVAVSANGQAVYINLIKPPLSTTIARNPHLLSLLKEILPACKLATPQVSVEHDFKRTVGYKETVTSTANDTIFYARQNRSELYTRFVKNRKSDATSILTVQLQEIDGKGYIISDVHIGGITPPPPGANNQTDESLSYWQDHAIIYNGQPLIASSVTKDCPYENASEKPGDDNATAKLVTTAQPSMQPS